MQMTVLFSSKKCLFNKFTATLPLRELPVLVLREWAPHECSSELQQGRQRIATPAEVSFGHIFS
jgi:hypothetical protein